MRIRNTLIFFMSLILCFIVVSAGEAATEEGETVTLHLYTEHSPPANFMENGSITGASTELVREICRRAGYKAEFSLLPWARAYKYARHNENSGIYSTTRIEERERLFQWIGPLVRISWALYAHGEPKFRIRNLNDAKYVDRIGVINKDAKAQYLMSQGFTNLDIAADSKVTFTKLLKDRVDLVISSSLGRSMFIKEHASSFNYPATSEAHLGEEIREVLRIREADLYLAMSHTTSEKIVRELRDALESMRRDGSFKEIFDKWYPEMDLPPLNP